MIGAGKYTSRFVKTSITVIFLLIFFAGTSTNLRAENTQTGADISVIAAQQQFHDFADAESFTLALSPYLQKENWALTLDLRWENIDGEYFVNNRKTNISSICERINTASSAQLERFLERRSRAGALIDHCNGFTSTTAESASGIADVSTYTSYSKPLDLYNIWYLMLTGGVTWDNADWENGLGSGTQDLFTEVAVSADNGKWFAAVMLGHNTVMGGDLERYYDNYLYGYGELGWHITERFRLSSRLNWSEASSDIDEDVTSLALTLNAAISQSVTAGITYTDFFDTDDYPNNELRGRLTLHF